MADTNLFQFWEEVENDAKWVREAMDKPGLGSDFSELSLPDQSAALGLALHLKPSHRHGCIGRA